MGRKTTFTVRKTPRQERSTATVEAILEAATYILTTRGWEAFTTNEIARKAGVNIASLYQYFPNKEAIVAELQRRHIQAIDRSLPAPPAELTLAGCLRLVLEAVVAEHRVHPALHRVFADELPRSLRLDAGPRPGEAAWAERIASLVAVPDADIAALVTRVAAHAIIHEAATARPELLEHPLFVPELVRLLEAYLSGGAPETPLPTQAPSPTTLTPLLARARAGDWG